MFVNYRLQYMEVNWKTHKAHKRLFKNAWALHDSGVIKIEMDNQRIITIVCHPNKLSVLFNVFNRWGGLVYENENYRSGDFNAREIEDGTYFYVLVLPNGREHKGSFTVSR